MDKERIKEDCAREVMRTGHQSSRAMDYEGVSANDLLYCPELEKFGRVGTNWKVL